MLLSDKYTSLNCWVILAFDMRAELYANVPLMSRTRGQTSLVAALDPGLRQARPRPRQKDGFDIITRRENSFCLHEVRRYCPTSNIRAVSWTVLAIGPVWSKVNSIGMMPVYGTNPYVGFSPTMPHAAAGILIEPPWSPPKAISTWPPATYQKWVWLC